MRIRALLFVGLSHCIMTAMTVAIAVAMVVAGPIIAS